MRCDAGSLVLHKVDSNKHTHTQWYTSRSVACGGVNKAQSVARVSASVTNSSPANAAHSASSSPYSTPCLSPHHPYVFLPSFLYPPCRCLRHCRAYQQHNLSWRVPQFPALLRSISLSLSLPRISVLSLSVLSHPLGKLSSSLLPFSRVCHNKHRFVCSADVSVSVVVDFVFGFSSAAPPPGAKANRRLNCDGCTDNNNNNNN